MLPQYRFYLKTDSDLDWVRTYPVWKDDLSIEWKMESGQMFHRSELSGSLDFISNDYTYIMSKTFGKVFKVKIEVSDGGGTWTHYWDGKFTLTDCKVNTDDRIITVKPQTVDNYTAILAGMDREYDLIKLKPEIVPLNMQRRPAVQIFDTASETVTCICGNISFEQEASLPAENPMQFLRNHCHFGVVESVVSVQVIDPPFGHEAAFAAPFTGTITGDGSILENGYGQSGYYMEYFEIGLVGDVVSYGLKVIAYAQPDTVQWQFAGLAETPMPGLPSLIEFEAKVSGEVNMNAECNDHGIYSRVICNVDQIQPNEPTFEIPNDDLVAYNRNYRRCYPYEVDIDDIFTWDIYEDEYATQDDPTEWGVADNGKYFVAPSPQGEYIPIGRNMWGSVSIWLHKTSSLGTIDNLATAGFVLKDSFPISSCIKVLLAEIAPSIKFEGTSDYSYFLYSGSDPLQGRNNALFITPKTNIINGEYETPAQKALCTLKDILQMLKNVYNCYWFIGTVNGYPALRIEHVQYFLNGGSYNGTPQVGINLTNMYNVRNWKTWDFVKNEYEYEKTEMPERFQFGWMDEVREIFKGKPIIVVSDFVEQGKIEEITVANFTSDVDYMQLNPSAISQDGFALLNAFYNINTGEFSVPVVYNVWWDSYNNSIQNGWLSYHELQSAYWRYNMPARTLNIEGIVNSGTRALSVSRNKKQSVSVPIGMPDSNGKDFDLMKLVTTALGDGQIYQASIRLTTRIAKLQLRFETEA